MLAECEAGLTVLGVDRDPEHVDRVNAGILPFIEVPVRPEVLDHLYALTNKGRFK